MSFLLQGACPIPFRKDPVFGFEVPTECEGVPAKVLDPSSSWEDKATYHDRYRQLAARFADNFKKFEDGCPREIIDAGPRR